MTQIFERVRTFAGKVSAGIIAKDGFREMILFGKGKDERFHKNFAKLFLSVSHGVGGQNSYKAVLLGIWSTGWFR